MEDRVNYSKDYSILVQLVKDYIKWFRYSKLEGDFLNWGWGVSESAGFLGQKW